MTVKGGGLLNKLNAKTTGEMETVGSQVDMGSINPVDDIHSLLNVLRLGTSNQKHDAAKAIGYIGKLGQLPAGAKIEAKNVLIDILENEYPAMRDAFAMAEALMRIDDDAFWTLVMSWYGQANKNVSNTLKKMKNP